ncbi:retron St85 family RNA-directed DNA polymerase [Citrobacter braakii]|uniref:retron St85 family RNA-directed DNA polymerase n=1 Tax=Citrobacter braakii TaxID=57706 RepID=UPI000541DF48|nr:retron St85 family RNA-directed DNA polymerase [Citrobacter braakii]KHE07953.1 DNA polymerase [Citrobacter braakii]
MENNWKTFFESRGIRDDFIDSYLKYIECINKNEIPVIFEVEHLSHLIGIKYPEINNIIYSPSDFYRTFEIPKRTGGSREISTPYPTLMKCQRWIYENILLKIPTHHCAYAYKKEHSIIKNAMQHVNNTNVIKIDLKNFFPSIPINWVINLFAKLGYSNNIPFILSALCCNDNCLPQGAITSPSLSNILLYSLDERLFKLSEKLGLTYTRYADDMIFSGKYTPPKTIEYIKHIIESYGFELNNRKTKILSTEKRKIITGIDISNNELKLPRRTRREIRKVMFFIKKYGLMNHMSNLKIKSPNYLLSLEGKINFWLQIEPTNEEALSYRDIVRVLKKSAY